MTAAKVKNEIKSINPFASSSLARHMSRGLVMRRRLLAEIKKLANPARAKVSQGYFKTGKGEYGEGDIFIGLTVPDQRLIAKKYIELPFGEVRELLKSKIHEHRFVALEILVFKYEKADVKEKKKIAKFYLKNRKNINNWDLVDTSSSYILGDWLVGKNTKVLYKLARSKNIWDRRIAIVTTQGFIRKGHYKDTLALAEHLLKDKHDLIHKASGWMLRELGNRSVTTLAKFLKKHAAKMPRTMLRYSIERFSVDERKYYLEMRIKS